MKSNKISLAIVALVCGVYAFGPDPFPIVIDDIIVGLIGAANVLKLLHGGNNNEPRLHD